MADWTGILELDAEKRYGKTVTKNLFFRGAFKIMRPVYHGRSNHPSYYLLNPGGGYLDGDTYRMKVSLDPDARVTMTTQAATKIYKTPEQRAYQEAEFHLAEGSHLEYLPDPLIAYQDARYLQKNVVHMARGSTFVYTDIVTPGWSPNDEFFSYKQLRLLNEFYYDGELAAYDHIKLQPDQQNMQGIGTMKGYTHLGSMIVVSETIDEAVIDQLYEKLAAVDEDVDIGISSLAVPGFSLRILAHTTQVIEGIVTDCHNWLSRECFQTQSYFLRKY